MASRAPRSTAKEGEKRKAKKRKVKTKEKVNK